MMDSVSFAVYEPAAEGIYIIYYGRTVLTLQNRVFYIAKWLLQLRRGRCMLVALAMTSQNSKLQRIINVMALRADVG